MGSFYDNVDEELDLNSANLNSSKTLVEDQVLNKFLIQNHCTTKKEIIETLEKSSVLVHHELLQVEHFDDFPSLFEDCSKDFFYSKINFKGWKSLKSIKLPERLLNLPSFYKCESLEELAIPESIYQVKPCVFIHVNTFFKCESLKSLTFQRKYGEICFSSESRYPQVEEIHLSKEITFSVDNFLECVPNAKIFRDF